MTACEILPFLAISMAAISVSRKEYYNITSDLVSALKIPLYAHVQGC